jgi:hypothetical protein
MMCVGKTGMIEHIAILSHKSVLEKILRGEKTVESRFSRVKSLPYGLVSKGDIIYFKLSGGQVLGRARVAAVQEYDSLNPQRIQELAQQYRRELAISVDFLARKLESKFATLIFLEQVEPCKPWTYKQEGRSGWIVLTSGELAVSEQAAPLEPTVIATDEVLNYDSVVSEIP